MKDIDSVVTEKRRIKHEIKARKLLIIQKENEIKKLQFEIEEHKNNLIILETKLNNEF